MKPQRVLALVHKGLEPPDEKVDKTTAQAAEWRMEYDVVRTLKVLGHELRVIGVHDDLTPIRTTMDDFKPTITFNLMEAFDDIIVRCRELKLRLAADEEETLQEFTVLLTVQVMNYLHSGRHRIAL